MTRDEDIDDLAMLIHCPVDVPPNAVDLDVRLVDEPPAADLVPARWGRVDGQGREPLHPTVNGDVINVDAPLGEELLQVPV